MAARDKESTCYVIGPRSCASRHPRDVGRARRPGSVPGSSSCYHHAPRTRTSTLSSVCRHLRPGIKPVVRSLLTGSCFLAHDLDGTTDHHRLNATPVLLHSSLNELTEG